MNLTIPAIRVLNVSKRFRVGFARRTVEAVKEISFQVQQGEIVGLVGPNGAGKTTSIKMLTGLTSPDSGSVSIYGSPPSQRNTRADLGYLPENPYFYEHLDIEEILRFYGQLFGLDSVQLDERLGDLISLVGLEHAQKRRISSFSKGMRQRAGIAQALVNDPKLIILDEPQTGLDPFGRRDVRNMILEFKQRGKTVLFSSHILPDVEAVCDRVVLMKGGKVVGDGTIAELTSGHIESYEIIARGVTQIPPLVTSHMTKASNTISMTVNSEADLQRVLSELLDEKTAIIGITAHREKLEDLLRLKY